VKQVRRSLGRLHSFDPRDKEAASIWDTVKNAEANRMIIVGMEVFMGAVGVATLFLGGLGVMKRDARLRPANGHAKSASAKRSAPRANPSSVNSFWRPSLLWIERRHGAAAVLRFLRAGESAAHAPVFCWSAHKLEAWRFVHLFCSV